MAKIVTAIFESRSSAELTTRDLMHHGVCPEDISMQMTESAKGREFFIEVSDKAPEGALVGTICGAMLGAATAYLTITGYVHPGFELARHGVLVGTLAGVGAGSLAGLFLGYLSGAFIPEYESAMQAVDTRKGKILLGVYCNERREEEVRKLLEAAGGGTLRVKSVPTEPIRLHTTTETKTDERDTAKDDVLDTSLAAELSAIKKQCTESAERIAKLESQSKPTGQNVAVTQQNS